MEPRALIRGKPVVFLATLTLLGSIWIFICGLDFLLPIFVPAMYEPVPVPLAYPVTFAFLAFTGAGFGVGAAGVFFSAYRIVNGRHVSTASPFFLLLQAFATIGVFAVAHMDLAMVESGLLSRYAQSRAFCAYASAVVVLLALLSHYLSPRERSGTG